MVMIAMPVTLTKICANSEPELIDQFEMPDKGQEHADAEHGERLLAADDQRDRISSIPAPASPSA